jgi:FkbM family methyltransferase
LDVPASPPASPAGSLTPDTLGHARVRDCRHGRMLYNIHDIYIGRSLDLYGEFSEGEIELFKRIVKPGDVVVDVGANIGAHTLWFAKATAPNGGVLAFEPQRLIFQALCANMALNGVTNAICRQEAVGAEPGQITVPVLDPEKELNFGGVELGEFTQGDQIPVVRLDDLPIGRCKLLKVDVEGMELAVLQGAAKLIGRLKPVLYVENDRRDRRDALIRYIDSLGYDCYWHYPMLFNPDNYLKNPTNVFEGVASINMVCVPTGTPVEGGTKIEVPAE